MTTATTESAPTRLKLWEITEELDAIGEALIEGGGELTPELEARLDALEGEFERKVERIALYVQECNANAAAVKLEADRLTARARAFERKADGLKNYLLFTMKRADWDKLTTPLVSVGVQKNSRPSIRWPGDPATAPEAFRRTIVQVDGQAAYEAYRAGDPLEGFQVVVGEHVRIR